MTAFADAPTQLVEIVSQNCVHFFDVEQTREVMSDWNAMKNEVMVPTNSILLIALKTEPSLNLTFRL